MNIHKVIKSVTINHQTATSVLTTFPLKINLSRKTLLRLTLMMILFLILPLLIFYLFQVGEIIKGNYLIGNYHQKIEALSLKNEMLEVEATQNLSLQNLESEIVKLNFVPVSQVRYIPVSYDYLVKESQ